MNRTPTIVGAGLAGLLAAHAWPISAVIEAAPGPQAAHKALLRFRGEGAAKLTGTEFRRVMVRKGIFDGEEFRPPTIALCNMYAHKTLGVIRDRSIWNIDPVERFIAPDDWYDRLIAHVGDRIHWGCTYEPVLSETSPIVSTAPMHAMISAHELGTKLGREVIFRRSAIRVQRWRLPKCDVFQTVYFPNPHTSIYRASITGSLLIVEESTHLEPEKFPLYWVARAFGIDVESAEPLDATEQKYGKVDELDPAVRKAILFKLTSEHNVYSLGRFATWRNILLDDVVDDIAVIKRLMNAQHPYDLSKHAHR